MSLHLYVYLLLQWPRQKQLFHLWQKVRGQVKVILHTVIFQGRWVCHV